MTIIRNARNSAAQAALQRAALWCAANFPAPAKRALLAVVLPVRAWRRKRAALHFFEPGETPDD